MHGAGCIYLFLYIPVNGDAEIMLLGLGEGFLHQVVIPGIDGLAHVGRENLQVHVILAIGQALVAGVVRALPLAVRGDLLLIIALGAGKKDHKHDQQGHGNEWDENLHQIDPTLFVIGLLLRIAILVCFICRHRLVREDFLHRLSMIVSDLAKLGVIANLLIVLNQP